MLRYYQALAALRPTLSVTARDSLDVLIAYLAADPIPPDGDPNPPQPAPPPDPPPAPAEVRAFIWGLSVGATDAVRVACGVVVGAI